MSTRRLRLLAVVIMLLIGVGISITLVLCNPWTGSGLEVTEIGQIDTGGRTAHVRVVGDIAFVIDHNEPTPRGLVLINVSDPQNPELLASFYEGGQAGNLDVADDIVYVADRSGGLGIFQFQW